MVGGGVGWGFLGLGWFGVGVGWWNGVLFWWLVFLILMTFLLVLKLVKVFQSYFAMFGFKERVNDKIIKRWTK